MQEQPHRSRYDEDLFSLHRVLTIGRLHVIGKVNQNWLLFHFFLLLSNVLARQRDKYTRTWSMAFKIWHWTELGKFSR